MHFATYILLFLLLLSSPLYSQGWQWQNPRPHGETINDMVMIDAGRGVAVCNNGYYMYTGDGGRGWTTYRLGRRNLECIAIARDGSLIVVADRQRIYRSTDNSFSWELVYSAQSPGRVPSYDLAITPDGTLLAMLNGAYFVKSTDNGQTWSRFAENNLQISTETTRSLSVQSNSVWYILGNWGLYRSGDSGATWEMTLERDAVRGLQRYVFVDSLYGYQLRDGQLLRTHDGGENWDEMDIFGFGLVNDIQAGPALGDAVFCMSLGRYLVNASSDGGETWNISLTETAFANAYPNTIAFVDARTGFIGGDGGRILRTEDGGQSWSIVHGIGYIGAITDLLFIDDDFGIASTYSPTVLVTTDGGRRWDEAIPSPEHSCDALAASPAGTLFLVSTTPSYDFDFLRSTDRGRSWQVLSRLPLQYSPTNPEMAQGMLAISDDDILVGGTFGLLLRSRDGGATWERSLVQPAANNPFSTGLQIFHFPPSTFIYMQSNGLQLSTDDGRTWEGRLTPRARTIWDAQFLTPDIGFGLISSEFSRTTDGGLTWESTEGFSPQLTHFFDADNGVAVWSDSQQDDLTYFMKTSDAGRSWEKYSMGERTGYNGWFFRSPTRLWGYGYGGAIRYSGDGGIVSADAPPAAAAGMDLLSGYPNPFSSSAHTVYRIPFEGAVGESATFTLHDMLGRVMRSVSIPSARAGEIEIPGTLLRGIAPGMYIYRLASAGTTGTGRLTIR
jgi:photosystem II stability/assembly factor-like uncharacterized protein